MMGSSHERRRQGEDGLETYLHDIHHYPLLSPQEEQRVARRAIRGDPDARERLITANLRLVISIAQRYRHLGVPLMDLIQEGNVGLITAVNKFDPALGYKFSTYATWWIRQAILRALVKYVRPVPVPDYLLAALHKIDALEDLHRQHHEPSPNAALLAEETGLSRATVTRLLRWRPAPPSLDRLSDDESDETPLDQIHCERASPEEEALRAREHETLKRALDKLPLRERRILSLRYGIEDRHPRTLSEIGRILNLSRERVRQLESLALSKLRKLYASRRSLHIHPL
ncbi:MAG: RNA polymerase sigma factor RpoD/SigA [Candidatus Bipolaricaulota bacterium]|nr:RNA polymerase sigma factor RpoD/SigA [Candidatus Bipolaricaulota bacterium]MDW8140892.1 RNA polymerase sigma factor RpoD/SigA [Candidatus Bipolaricaulota bacterium]